MQLVNMFRRFLQTALNSEIECGYQFEDAILIVSFVGFTYSGLALFKGVSYVEDLEVVKEAFIL